MAHVLKVRRSEPELVKPAKPTPNELKPLSDWDDRVLLRHWLSFVVFYRPATMPGVNKDPAETIKGALAEGLVYYYPWAGRLKEQGPDKRLVVDCTAEGVVFVTADADVTLDQFGEIRPPFSDILYYKPVDSTETLGCPIFMMQVTRLACGGFVLGFSFPHVMSDIAGAVQFVTAVSELAHGAPTLSVQPVWQRELLNARGAFVPLKQTNFVFPKCGSDDMTYRSFFFGPKELEAIQAHLPQRYFTSFELIFACVFHCRIISSEHEPTDHVQASFTVNARSKFVNPPLPSGYYGNASFIASIISPMQSFHDLLYVVEEVKKAKEAVNEDYIRSSIEEEVTMLHSDVPPPVACSPYAITDISRLGLFCLDFGWGKPVYASNVDGIEVVHFVNYIVEATNNEGDEGKLITLYMPKDAMDKFEHTLRTLLGSI